MSEGLTPSILVLPACASNQGGGHLSRSLLLVQNLRKAGAEAYLFPVEGPIPPYIKERYKSFLLPEKEEPEDRVWTFLILDGFRTSPAAFNRWSALAPVIGLDEGGSLRASFDYLVDLLPNLEKKYRPNLFVPSWLSLPAERRPHFSSTGTRVLVSFGAEDAAGLTVPAALSLTEHGCTVTVVFGALCTDVEQKKAQLDNCPGIDILLPHDNLKECFSQYDLVVTHFGLGCFEALYARVPVLLVNPGSYHQKLSESAVLYSCGIGQKAASRAGRCFSRDAQKILQISKAAAEKYFIEGQSSFSMAERMLAWSFPYTPVCPLCGCSTKGSVIERFEEKSYRRCPSCAIVYMQRPAFPAISYNQDYFFKDYKNQYGKTYLEDFSVLEKMGKRRLAIIDTIRKRTKKVKTQAASLLDIGCAYGPFLFAAKSCGYRCTGLEIADEAARYVHDNLDIPVLRGLFPDAAAQLAAESFSVITLWYVIEHFSEPGIALSRISTLLEPGGILAFSTPSMSGLSAKKDRRTFLKQSPEDHWTVWDPCRTAAQLSRYKLHLVRLVNSGHHPERFPLLGKWLSSHTGLVSRLLYRFLHTVSRVFHLGDTYEAYAIKEEDKIS